MIETGVIQRDCSPSLGTADGEESTEVSSKQPLMLTSIANLNSCTKISFCIQLNVMIDRKTEKHQFHSFV